MILAVLLLILLALYIGDRQHDTPTARALKAPGDRDARPLVVYCTFCSYPVSDDPGMHARSRWRCQSYTICTGRVNLAYRDAAPSYTCIHLEVTWQ